MSLPAALHAFAGYGIELEYMIVERKTLAVRPIADALLRTCDGSVVNEVSRGHFAWSNEVVLHLIELKNQQPDATLGPLGGGFQAEVHAINAMLESLGACLMPTAMHPWMNPATETMLWPHEHAEIYQTYDQIFNCRRHGWANLQSMHLNLPFASDTEFVRLHDSVRLILPILPALAASSPIADGRASGFQDFRMENYCGHQIKVPATIGEVIPDRVASSADYQDRILAPMLNAIAPLDPEKILRHEWLNARGAIPRFDRNALEIRIIDMQECPQADVAIAAAASAVVKTLYDADDNTELIATANLVAIFQDCIRDAEQAVIDDAEYLALLGYPGNQCRAGELWRFLIETHLQGSPDYHEHWQHPLETILDQGPLARRILNRVGHDVRHSGLKAVYCELCDCLQTGRMFESGHG
jgi:carboxylate-amine ligase